MNILVPHSWLKDYFKENILAEKIAEELSLHSFSVEKIIKEKGESIFEIEITPNRGDALSILGIARELGAIFSKKIVEKKAIVKKGEEKDILKVEIKNKNLVSRFSAIILDNVDIKESPKIIKERLLKVGIRPINNIVDITNYLMIDRGQPMHAFDFDKIKGEKMVIQESKKGEIVKTLDGVERILPEGVIIIKDGENRIIDLCGIMGAENSQIDKDTKKVLLFVQVYDPVKIRKASMTLAHRTDSAVRFEKGVDFEGVISSLWIAVDMAEKLANAKVSSKLIDIKNKEYKPNKISIDYNKINDIAGVDISKKDIDNILKYLNFKIEKGKAIPPSFRYGDIEIIEDLAEEVVRIYGYHKILPKLFNGGIPNRNDNSIFEFEDLAKDFLRHRGFYECYNYTLTKKENILKEALEVINPLTKDLTYLRDSLIPQLLEVVEKNKDKKEKIMVFEISNIFIYQKSGLPLQPICLGLAIKGIDYLEIKGIVDSLFEELGVSKEKVNFEIKNFKKDIFTIEINFEDLLKNSSKVKKYIPISKFSPIKEDLTLVVSDNVIYQDIEKIIFETDKRIEKLEFKCIYKNFLTLFISYLDKEKQISSDDTKEIRNKIFYNLENKLGIKLKK